MTKRLTKDEAVKKMIELAIKWCWGCQMDWDDEINFNKITFDTIYFKHFSDGRGDHWCECWRLTERDETIYFVECDEQGEVLEDAFEEDVREFFCLDNPKDINGIEFLLGFERFIPSDY